MRPALLLAALALSGCSACADGPGAVRPAYSDSVPSPEAQGHLQAVFWREVPVGTAGVTEAGWRLVDFGVVPSDAAPRGKGPVARIRNGERFREIFVPDDAAVDALVRAVTRAAEPK